MVLTLYYTNLAMYAQICAVLTYHTLAIDLLYSNNWQQLPR